MFEDSPELIDDITMMESGLGDMDDEEDSGFSTNPENSKFPNFMRESGENLDFKHLKHSIDEAADDAFLDDLLDDLDI